MATEKFERLPKNVKPVNYDVFIKVSIASCKIINKISYFKTNFDTFKFSGTVCISAEVLEATKVVKMNCADIEIQNAKVGGQDAKFEFNVKNEEVTLTVNNEVSVGNTKIEIDFTGTHNDQMKGFYRTKHTSENGDYYSLVTQFESTDARRALPCWDEPRHDFINN